ncbi:CPBP family intramembrane metalloprotease [Christensenellaceae bacterium OttesenSCG-928-L17]|nr:CPBP family intramembrane metalloprotease [Christensenellaceae bacterium OttesenSCG-928-L17]
MTTKNKPTRKKVSVPTSQLSDQTAKTSPKPRDKTLKTLSSVLYVVLFMLWVFLSLVIGQVIVGAVLFSILGENLYQNTLWTTVYTALSYALSCFFVIYLPSKFKKLKLSTNREELGLSGWPKWRDILIAIIGFFVYLFLATILIAIFSWLFSWFDASEAQNIGYSNLYNAGSRILAFVGLVIIAPIAEELIFRGWLYGKLRRHTPIWIATILVSLLFGFAHSSWSVAVNVFAMSAVMCLMRELTGTIYSTIILHIIKNAVAVFLLLYSGML